MVFDLEEEFRTTHIIMETDYLIPITDGRLVIKDLEILDGSMMIDFGNDTLHYDLGSKYDVCWMFENGIKIVTNHVSFRFKVFKIDNIKETQIENYEQLMKIISFDDQIPCEEEDDDDRLLSKEDDHCEEEDDQVLSEEENNDNDIQLEEDDDNDHDYLMPHDITSHVTIDYQIKDHVDDDYLVDNFEIRRLIKTIMSQNLF